MGRRAMRPMGVIKPHPPCVLCGCASPNALRTDKGVVTCRDAIQCDMRIMHAKINITSTWVF